MFLFSHSFVARFLADHFPYTQEIREYLCEITANIEIFLRGKTRVWGLSKNVMKKLSSKISCYSPFKMMITAYKDPSHLEVVNQRIICSYNLIKSWQIL